MKNINKIYQLKTVKYLKYVINPENVQKLKSTRI